MVGMIYGKGKFLLTVLLLPLRDTTNQGPALMSAMLPRIRVARTVAALVGLMVISCSVFGVLKGAELGSQATSHKMFEFFCRQK